MDGAGDESYGLQNIADIAGFLFPGMDDYALRIGLTNLLLDGRCGGGVLESDGYLSIPLARVYL